MRNRSNHLHFSTATLRTKVVAVFTALSLQIAVVAVSHAEATAATTRTAPTDVAFGIPISEPLAMVAGNDLVPTNSVPQQMDCATASSIRGEGWIKCIIAISGAVGMAGSLGGAVVGALIFVCGCEEELAEFGLDYEEFCDL